MKDATRTVELCERGVANDLNACIEAPRELRKTPANFPAQVPQFNTPDLPFHSGRTGPKFNTPDLSVLLAATTFPPFPAADASSTHGDSDRQRELWKTHNADTTVDRGSRPPPTFPPSASFPVRDIMKICGACVRELPDGSYSEEQRGLRQSIRRCEECVAAGNQLVLMKKGRTRSEADDCPICQLPLPLDMEQSAFQECCMKRVCNGCILAAGKRGMRDCPFCRTQTSDSDDEKTLAMIRKRVAAGDPMALFHLGTKYHFGEFSNGLEKNMTRAVELYESAAELGVKEAHYNLGCLYDKGTDVEKDMAKAIRHYEAAAVCGHVKARYNLGATEYNAGNRDLALQHYLISAKLGHDVSLNKVKDFVHGRSSDQG
ncbi:hypothetical protein THAOC_33376 [Thalassiosira oceanica]|uniref:RING-type domain-containing protein n=1 Tax=Thalassiosira oceanica TaxID=159749 RepID=K0R753_THAOC|nr:hypothetical protein THAOC_33376 [Thalassiosira oceanica]|eukprot:EJK47874.1 hypothetical protein THAOC_33376 [Thalassiosira oceanica]